RRNGLLQAHRDRSSPCAEIDRAATCRQELGCSARELLTVEPRNVDTGIDLDGETAERRDAGDPCERLPLLAPLDPPLQGVAIGRGREELGRLLPGGDAARARQAAGQGRRVDRHPFTVPCGSLGTAAVAIARYTARSTSPSSSRIGLRPLLGTPGSRREAS